MDIHQYIHQIRKSSRACRHFLISLNTEFEYITAMSHDDSATQVDEFMDRLRDSASRVLQVKARYKKVVTLIAYWQKPDHEAELLDHLKASAKSLRILSEETYGFDVDDDVFEIPDDKYAYNKFRKLTERIELIQEVEQSLVILYYAHGITESHFYDSPHIRLLMRVGRPYIIVLCPCVTWL